MSAIVAFSLCAAVVLLGLWLLDRLFPRQRHKEEDHVERH